MIKNLIIIILIISQFFRVRKTVAEYEEINLEFIEIEFTIYYIWGEFTFFKYEKAKRINK